MDQKALPALDLELPRSNRARLRLVILLIRFHLLFSLPLSLLMKRGETTRTLFAKTGCESETRVTGPYIHPQMASTRATIAPPPLVAFLRSNPQPFAAALFNTAHRLTFAFVT